jgi:hypothetical protein
MEASYSGAGDRTPSCNINEIFGPEATLAAVRRTPHPIYALHQYASRGGCESMVYDTRDTSSVSMTGYISSSLA